MSGQVGFDFEPTAPVAEVNQHGYLTWPLEILSDPDKVVEIRLGRLADGWRFGVHYNLVRAGISEMPKLDQPPRPTREDALERAKGRLLAELEHFASQGDERAARAVLFVQTVA